MSYTMNIAPGYVAGIVDLMSSELDAICGGETSDGEKLAATAGIIATGSALAGGPTNPLGAGLLAAAATVEILAITVSIFDN